MAIAATARFLAVAIVLVSPAISSAHAEAEITFSFEGVSSLASDVFRHDIREARQRVLAWWGPTFEGPIAVEVTPNQIRSMALVPAWRGEPGRMIFGARRVVAREAATIHEIIHVYAPNSNRILAEGLAVYGHDRLGGNPAYPNFGRDLHSFVAATANRPLLLSLERVATPEPLEPLARDGEAVAGSFVRFLIERFGMETFRRLYSLTPLRQFQRDPGDPGRWRNVYGRLLDELAGLWLAELR